MKFSTLLIINQLRVDTPVSQIYFGMKLYMFRTVSLSIIRRFSLYTRQWFHPDPARNLLANLYDIYHCCVYSEKLLMMDRGTVRNM